MRDRQLRKERKSGRHEGEKMKAKAKKKQRKRHFKKTEDKK